MIRCALRRVLAMGLFWALITQQIAAVVDGGVLNDSAARVVAFAGADVEHFVVHAAYGLVDKEFSRAPPTMADLKRDATAVAASVAKRWPVSEWTVGNWVTEDARTVFFIGPVASRYARDSVVVVSAAHAAGTEHVKVAIDLLVQNIPAHEASGGLDVAARRREMAWWLARAVSVSPALIATGTVISANVPGKSPSELRATFAEAGAVVKRAIVVDDDLRDTPGSESRRSGPTKGWTMQAGNVHVQLSSSPSGTQVLSAVSTSGIEHAQHLMAKLALWQPDADVEGAVATIR